jgi:hypothetical protein
MYKEAPFPKSGVSKATLEACPQFIYIESYRKIYLSGYGKQGV